MIDEQVMHEMIKLLRLQQVDKAGTVIYKYGTTQSYGNTSHLPSDMEAFFIIRGKIGLKAPRLKE